MTDPAVQAVASALPGLLRGLPVADVDIAELTVDAYRRHVLASRSDGAVLRRVEEWISSGSTGVPTTLVRSLLAALADETAAREAAEAERERRSAPPDHEVSGLEYEPVCDECHRPAEQYDEKDAHGQWRHGGFRHV